MSYSVSNAYDHSRTSAPKSIKAPEQVNFELDSNALSFLHDEVEVIHTGVLVTAVCLKRLVNESLLIEFEQAEIKDLSMTKVTDKTRTIYGSWKPSQRTHLSASQSSVTLERRRSDNPTRV